MSEQGAVVAGVDVGTESVKVVILQTDGAIVGRAVVPTRGYFQERCRETLDAAPAAGRVSVGRSALARAMLVGLDRALRDLLSVIA